MSNVEELIHAGIIAADHTLSETDVHKLEELSPVEVAALIHLREKLEGTSLEGHPWTTLITF